MKKFRLSPLERSHLISLASGEGRTIQTLADLKAITRLVELKLAVVGSYDEAEGDPDGWNVSEAGRKWARTASNIFTKAQIAKLHKRIKAGKPWIPRVGDLVYMDTRLSIDHGEDDVQGGLAQVTKVYKSMSGGDADCRFIEVAQHERGGNWTQFLCPDQAELMKRFGDQVAYPDPDYTSGYDPHEWS